MRQTRGFTLIELLIVVAIVAILAAIAIPAFADAMRKSRRSDAMQALGDIQLKQERWRASHATYDTIANVGGSATSADGHYAITLSMPTGAGTCTCSTATCFQLTATAQGAQASDTTCSPMVLTNRCGTIAKTPTTGRCWH